MKSRSKLDKAASSMRDKIIGLGERSLRKSYYPQLLRQLEQAEKDRQFLEEKSAAMMRLLEDLKQARDSLTESETRYRALVENINDVIFTLDTKGVFTYISPVIQNFGGLTPEEVVGTSFKEFVHPDDLSTVIAAFEHVLTGLREPQEYRVYDKRGQLYYVRTSSRPLLHDGHVVGLTGIMSDITERKRAEEELVRHKEHLEEIVQQRTEELRLARDAAEAANKAKSTFLANMSHELRTPLNSILGFSQMMSKAANLDEMQRNNMEIINSSGEHLLKLINDVLEIAKIEAGKLQLEIAPFDLHEVVREVSDMMRLRAQQKGLQLELDQSSEFPRYIKGDEARLRQILVNLVSNAVKFTEKGGVTIRLSKQKNAQPHLLIEIEDTGPGINEADRKRLFKPFVQLPTGKMQEGTGLGLAIVRQFVQLMEGDISVESRPGSGTQFRIVLPLNEPDKAELLQLRRESHGEVTGLVPGQPLYRILIAEDQRDNQTLLTRLMTNLGLEVKAVRNGEECIEQFKEWKPDLIWMDRRMPIMDGLEATRQIRQLPGGDRVKIIAVTASALKEQEASLRAAGMDDYVSKPYRFDEIYDTLASQLGLKLLYSDESPDGASATPTLTPDMLAAIDDALRAALRDALNALDRQQIEGVIRQIGEKDPHLAKLLKSHTANFDYPTILSALNQTKL
jgi:PAS domain S-box-containing protein